VNRDLVIRRALRASAVFNFGGALLFAFPESLGSHAGFPVPVSHFYTTFVAFLVALFGATYAWLARQPHIDRPLVAFSALGKTGFFVVVVSYWLLGDVPGRGVLGAIGDLGFAALFTWWLVQEPAAPTRPE
jgi:hypothetical protein